MWADPNIIGKTAHGKGGCTDEINILEESSVLKMYVCNSGHHDDG